MDTEKLFTVQEAAARIGVSQSAIRNATLQGRLPFLVKFGRKLIEQEALTAYQLRTQSDGIKPRGRPSRARPEATAPPATGGQGKKADEATGQDGENSGADIAVKRIVQ